MTCYHEHVTNLCCTCFPCPVQPAAGSGSYNKYFEQLLFTLKISVWFKFCTRAQVYLKWLKTTLNQTVHTGDKPLNCPDQVIWSNMKEPTMLINHSAAKIVTTNIHDNLLWRAMKEPVRVEKIFRCSQCHCKCSRLDSLWVMEESTLLGKNTSAALNSTTRAQVQAMWGGIKESTLGTTFSCSHCDYKSSRLSDLKSHKRIYTGD